MALFRKSPNNEIIEGWYHVVATCIGIGMIFFGLISFTDRLYYEHLYGVIDLGEHHKLIGIGSFLGGIIYLFLIISGFLKGAED